MILQRLMLPPRSAPEQAARSLCDMRFQSSAEWVLGPPRVSGKLVTRVLLPPKTPTGDSCRHPIVALRRILRSRFRVATRSDGSTPPQTRSAAHSRAAAAAIEPRDPIERRELDVLDALPGAEA